MSSEDKMEYNLGEDTKKVSSGQVMLSKFFTMFLLTSPLIMGVIINSLGNSGPIKKRIYIQYNGIEGPAVLTVTEADIQTLPKYIWSMRCFFPIGGMVGALLGGYLSNKLGRKISTGIFLSSVVIGSSLKIVSYYTHFSVIFIGCFFDGVGASGLMVVDLMLMFELNSAQMTKYAKPLVQIFINLGIFMVACVTLNSVAGDNYHYTFLLPAILAAINAFAVVMLPESPVYIMEKTNDMNKVKKVLVKVHGEDYESYLRPLIESKESEVKEDDNQISVLDLFKNPLYRMPIIIAIILHCAQQTSGINAVMAFAPDILTSLGFENPDTASLIILGVALFGSIIFAPMVATFRRKVALLIGHSVMGVSLLSAYICQEYDAPKPCILFFFCLFVFIFQIGPGPLVWFITLEIFPKKATNSAQAICVCANWSSNALVFATADIGKEVFLVFTAANLIFFIFCLLLVVETINRNSDDILDEYTERAAKLACC